MREKKKFEAEEGSIEFNELHNANILTINDKMDTRFHISTSGKIYNVEQMSYVNLFDQDRTNLIMNFMKTKKLVPETNVEEVSPENIRDNFGYLGLALSKEGRICSLFDLPNGFETLEGVPQMSDLVIPSGAVIPDNLTVHGDLILGHEIKSLTAKGLKVDGKIFARGLKYVSPDIPTENLIITENDVERFEEKGKIAYGTYFGNTSTLSSHIKYPWSEENTEPKVKMYSAEEVEQLRNNLKEAQKIPFKITINGEDDKAKKVKGIAIAARLFGRDGRS